MENKFTKNFNLITISLVVFQILFIVVVVVAIQNIFKEENPQLELEVTGLQQEIEELTENGKRSIEISLYNAMANNSGSGTVQQKGIYIREGSLIKNHYGEIGAGTNYVNFIADIPDVGQSYQVFYDWVDDGYKGQSSPNNVAKVVCLDSSQLIYGEFDCDRSNDGEKMSEVIGKIYMFGYFLPGHPDITVRPNVYSDISEAKLKINYVSCESQCNCVKASEERQKEALKAFDGFVRGLGFRSEDIPHYFDNCS